MEPNSAKDTKLTDANASIVMSAVSAQLSGEPYRLFEGRGAVICGGGLKYFLCAWVCINMLRTTGWKHPIQLWHLGAREMTSEMRGLLREIDVECIDAHAVRLQHPARILNGWEIKPFALMHSPFREVLLLDADNVPIRNPDFLFETPEYIANGSIFWPDFNRLSPLRRIWTLAGVPYRNEPEFESGQIVIDKPRVWRALSLAMWMNEHSDFWYAHIHGDKETFHMAWRKLDQAYAMPSRPIYALPNTMCQHDFQGKRLFQHRNTAKWTISGNQRIPGFRLEDQCIEILEKLAPYWRGITGARL